MAATERNHMRIRSRGQVTIDVLPDNVLLDIFDLCLGEPDPRNSFISRPTIWQKLVHVCRRWRDLVFQSPRRLDLQILCTIRKPVRERLYIWPALPLAIWVGLDFTIHQGMDDIFAALEHRDRICTISIDHLLETLLPMMQEPLPALTVLDLEPSVSHIPDSFLGGSAPHLRYLYLDGIRYPALPKLLLSATDLVILALQNIPYSGYISPEAIATVLSSLTSLKSFTLGFKSLQSRPDPESPCLPPPTLTVLPALIYFDFEGVYEYFEDLLARIDAVPLLDRLQIRFFNKPIFHTPHLSRFISCVVPKFRTLKEAHVVISYDLVYVRIPSPARVLGVGVLAMGILCRDRSDLSCQPLDLARLCTSSLSQFLTVENLYMTSPMPDWLDSENIHWLELLYPFTAVKNLYLSKTFAQGIAPALRELIGERGTKVLPALQNIFLAELQSSGHVQQAIEQFIYVRQLFGHSIVLSQWDVREDMRWQIGD